MKKNQDMIKKIIIIAVIIIVGFFIFKEVRRYFGLYMGAQVTQKSTEGMRGRLGK